jgi:hypothetical protein
MIYYENNDFVNLHSPALSPYISFEHIIVPVGASTLYCNKQDIVQSPLYGIWKVKETNPRTYGGIIELGSNPPVNSSFFTYVNLWNSYFPDNLDNGCGCDIEEGWESGWEGESEWIEAEIEAEEFRPPDTSGSYISPIVIHNGNIIRIIIRDKKQADDLKSMGMVLSNEAQSGLIKCSCGKNIWASNEEAAKKICDYIKALLGKVKPMEIPEKYGDIQKKHPERILYDFEKNLLGVAQKEENGSVKVYMNEARILELSKNELESTNTGKEEYIKSVRTYLETGNTPKMLNKCWRCWTVLCNNPNHPPGCGWTECGWVNCGGHVLEVSGRYKHPEIIIYDSEKNFLAMSIKDKNGVLKIFIDEARIIELSQERIKSLNISNKDYIKSLQDYLTTRDYKTYQPGQPVYGETTPVSNCVTVYCNNPNHPPGCGWLECNP